MRILPPSISKEYCRMHDEGIYRVLWTLLGSPELSVGKGADVHQRASLPAHLGGLGLRSEARIAPAAHFAAWADAIHVMHKKTPDLAQYVERVLSGVEVAPPGSLGEVRAAQRTLEDEGFGEALRELGLPGCPSWAELRLGARPPAVEDPDPGEWARGWQFFASRARDRRYKQATVLPRLSRAERALLLSQSGVFAGRALTVQKGRAQGPTDIPTGRF